MAYTKTCTNTNIISLQEYVEYVKDEVDVLDDMSVVESAPMLRALSNNKQLLIDKFNNELLNFDTEKPTLYSQSSFLLETQYESGFYVRGNIWAIPSQEPLQKNHEERLFSYHHPHDHNFSFMTTNWFGPGYETEIWEYDYDSTQGYVGEIVPLRFLEHVQFSDGKVMYYRSGKDVHIQYPPKSLSISLNLMLFREDDLLRDQYIFDLMAKKITGYPETMVASRRVAMIGFTKYLNNEETPHLLETLANTHACRRTRIACFDALRKIVPSEAVHHLEAASRDSDPVVRDYATHELRMLSA